MTAIYHIVNCSFGLKAYMHTRHKGFLCES